MVLQFFFFGLLCCVWAQDIIFEKEDDVCQLPGGRNGICRNLSLCPEAYEDYPRVSPVICRFDRRMPVVCCPVKGPITGEPPANISVPLHDLSAPPVDFSCGDSFPEVVFILTGSGCPNCGPGGYPAREVTAKYSALVGSREEDGSFDWFCSGVLINRQWVLTAAHCFSYKPINVVRLGEHDYRNMSDGANEVDFDVGEKFLYPEFKEPQGYHDLALLKLARPARLHRFVNPVCLPWGDARNRRLLNEKVSLTGWGALEFGGKGSSIIQEVNVTVFSTSVCDQSYSTLRDYRIVWPRGIGRFRWSCHVPQ
ncbi:venom protease-like isoform X2 [Macrobrachium nipponense]|uniref:venom protease-like isoform X2 n=1 Tax=Macrobrachium nipponense TaxID=159736 RepID=UPI0030C8ADFF